MKWFSHGFQEIALKSSGFQEIALKSRRECMDLCRIDVLRELESQHNDRKRARSLRSNQDWLRARSESYACSVAT